MLECNSEPINTLIRPRWSARLTPSALSRRGERGAAAIGASRSRAIRPSGSRIPAMSFKGACTDRAMPRHSRSALPDLCLPPLGF